MRRIAARIAADLATLKAEALGKLEQAYAECPYGGLYSLGQKIYFAKAGRRTCRYSLVWRLPDWARPDDAPREKLIVHADNMRDLDVIYLALWQWLDERKNGPHVIQFPAQRSA